MEEKKNINSNNWYEFDELIHRMNSFVVVVVDRYTGDIKTKVVDKD